MSKRKFKFRSYYRKHCGKLVTEDMTGKLKTKSKYKRGYSYCKHCGKWVTKEDLIRIADIPIYELFNRVNRCKKMKNPEVKYNRLLHKECHRGVRTKPRFNRNKKTKQEMIVRI